MVVAHRRAYPMLVGRDIEVDCRRRLGFRSFLLLTAPRPRAAHLLRTVHSDLRKRGSAQRWAATYLHGGVLVGSLTIG